MATHMTLVIGDVVTHPDWPDGATAEVIGFAFFQRSRIVNGRTRVVDDPAERVALLDRAMPDSYGEADSRWMEAGLIPMGPP